MDKLRKHIEEVITISDEEFDHIKTFFTVKKMKKHQYLLQEGDTAKHEYVIMSGIFRVFYLDDEAQGTRCAICNRELVDVGLYCLFQ